MRKGLQGPSADRGAAGGEQAQVEDEVPRGAHLRLHGEHDAQAVHTDNRLGAGDGGDRADQPDLQHVALRANRQAQAYRNQKPTRHNSLIHTYAQTVKKMSQKFVK